jgi:CheY-like chemotaxis protein
VVLVVEDDGLLRGHVADDLREAGCTVWEATSGEDALTFLSRAGELDLLITDLQLKEGITGWEVAKAFRARDSHLPVIYASGNLRDNRRQVADSAFVSKPYSSSQLLDAYHHLRSH